MPYPGTLKLLKNKDYQDTISEFVRKTPEMIEQWYNIFCNPQNNTTEKQVQEKVKVG
jgi:hypothetical protein